MQKALILCEKMFDSTEGKTAHELLRYLKRFEIVGIIDSLHNGEDSGVVLDNVYNDIPFYKNIADAINANPGAKFLIIGIATDGGRLPHFFRPIIAYAISHKMSIVNGLHEYLSEDREFLKLAALHGVDLIDVRKLSSGSHFFSGEIENVKAVKIVILGTDSAIGKRTTALKIKEALINKGLKVAFIGTGQTSWMQGEKYVSIIDSTINDFVSGELEHITVRHTTKRIRMLLSLKGKEAFFTLHILGGLKLLLR